MWARVVECMLGLWLVLSPFIFGHFGSNTFLTYNDFICGALVVTLCLFSFWDPLRHIHFANIAIALWLMISAYVGGGYPAPFGYQNEMFSGLTLILFSIIPNDAINPPRAWREFFALKQVESPEQEAISQYPSPEGEKKETGVSPWPGFAVVLLGLVAGFLKSRRLGGSEKK